MRFSPAAICLALVTVFFAHSSASAQIASTVDPNSEARRELYLAKLALQQYWQIDYPRQRRELNAAIELTEQVVDDLKVQLRSYGPYTRFSTGQPFMLTIQKARLCLREAELQLDDLRAERNALVRFHTEDWKVLEMRVQEARMRVAQLESPNVAASKAAAPSARELSVALRDALDSAHPVASVEANTAAP